MSSDGDFRQVLLDARGVSIKVSVTGKIKEDIKICLLPGVATP